MGHVLARVSGFGWTVLPVFPYRFRRIDEQALRIEHDGVSAKAATFNIDATGPRLELSPSTLNPADVCDLLPSDVADDFRVETSVFTAGWPAGFDIVSTGPSDPSPFDFVNDECVVYVQGPLAAARVVRLEAMCAPGQHVTDRGVHAKGEWIEVVYEHDGRTHWQRHVRLDWSDGTALVLTAQSPAALAANTRAAAAFVIDTLQPRRERGGP